MTDKQLYVKLAMLIDKGFLSTLWIMFPEKFDKVIEDYGEHNSKSRVFQHLKTT